MNALRDGLTYVKENSVVVGISIVLINTVEPLRELHVTHFLPHSRIHQEAHGFSKSFTVVDVMITIQIEEERGIRENGGDSD
jgi:hypothetical protein